MISLSSEGKFSLIDSVVEKVSKIAEEKKNLSVEKSSSYEIISSTDKKGSTSQKFEIIEEEDEEEIIDEQDIEKVIAEVEEKKEEEVKRHKPAAKYQKQLVTLKIEPLDLKMKDSKIYDSICYTWFIAKDQGVEINWKKPLLQKSQIRSYIKIA